MNVMQEVVGGGYRATQGHVLINRAGEEIRWRYETMKRQIKALDAAYAGALLASVFSTRPWLQALHLSVGAERTHDDGSGSCRTIKLRVSQVKPLEGAPLPPDLEINGQFDDDAAAFELERSLGDGSIGLYEALAIDPAEDVDIEETLSREPINELLQVEDIDGHAAFARLCPHRAAELKLA